MTWEESNTEHLQELDQIKFMDCIPREEELGDFFTEVGPLANTEDPTLRMLSDDLMVVDVLPMDFMSTQGGNEQPATHSHFPHDCETVGGFSSSSSIASDIQDLESQYQTAIEQLRVSMKRSQETRQQIIQNQLLLQPTTGSPVAGLFPDSKEFFAGSRSTLTSRLEQSRTMLMSYMDHTESL